MEPIKIAIVDAQYLIRTGLRCILQKYPEFRVIAELADAEHLVELILEQKPDLVIIDYNQEGFIDYERFIHILNSYTSVRFLVISNEKDKDRILHILEQGVSTFLTKTCDEEEIVSAAKAAVSQDKYFCTKILDLIMDKSCGPAVERCQATGLSNREVEIVRLVVEGFSAKEIGETLFLSPHTVYTHRKNIMRKLHINSTSELVMYAVSTGIVDAFATK